MERLGDTLSFQALSYTFNSSTSALPVLGGIFTLPAPQTSLEIIATSIALSNVGVYVFTIPVTDGDLAVSETFSLEITNTPPSIISSIANRTVRQQTDASYDIT